MTYLEMTPSSIGFVHPRCFVFFFEFFTNVRVGCPFISSAVKIFQLDSSIYLAFLIDVSKSHTQMIATDVCCCCGVNSKYSKNIRDAYIDSGNRSRYKNEKRGEQKPSSLPDDDSNYSI